jgi:hypothetical protein
VENVRGAQPWVGRSRWAYGSYHLWGDVPALMPFTLRAQKFNPDGTAHPPGSWFKIADSENRGGVKGSRDGGVKALGMNWSGAEFGLKGVPHWTAGHGTNPAEHEGVKVGGGADGWFEANGDNPLRVGNSHSPARKAASAIIAKIPEALARHIARTYRDG